MTTTTRTAITFETGKYVMSHGKQPRGEGMWLFQVRGVNQENGMFGAYGTLTEAKRKVSKQIREKVGTTIPRDVFNHLRVDVMP